MKKVITILSLMLLVLAMSVSADKPKNKCTTIQSGELLDSSSNQIVVGYNDFGYNYQAHTFNGLRWGYHVIEKWNDAWISNKDCDGDGKLDRHFGYDTYIGSGAWLTNHWTTTYMMDNVECYYEDFAKIIAVPADAILTDNSWYTTEGILIGESIWSQFAIIQFNIYDSCNAEINTIFHERMPGLGNW